MKNYQLSRPRFISIVAASAALLSLPLFASAAEKDSTAKKGKEVTMTGEVLDMACYLDHGASGEGHAGCAEKCIKGGLPVGLKTADGSTYLLIGDHEPANEELSKFAAKTITVRGKLVERDGFKMIENIEVVKS